ncbi:hypothetical protein, partial [Desertimonas flava]|uniref:hypothetical protein n=1 Tax=Desertimonas flava TaxID=2064846 RepID=UPI0023F2832F
PTDAANAPALTQTPPATHHPHAEPDNPRPGPITLAQGWSHPAGGRQFGAGLGLLAFALARSGSVRS